MNFNDPSMDSSVYYSEIMGALDSLHGGLSASQVSLIASLDSLYAIPDSILSLARRRWTGTTHQ